MSASNPGRTRVQSVDRAFALLDSLARRGGRASLGELCADTGLAAATVHRLCGTLAESGHLRRDARRDYLLGPRLQRIGEVAGRATWSWAQPVLAAVVDGTGETANLAVREGDGVVYLAQVPSPHSMRMFTEVGRRVHVHCTAVGKALVARDDDDEVRAMLERTGMPGYTDATIVDPDRLLDELARVRRVGFATDESEQEEGVRCVAITVGVGDAAVAVSASGPEARFTEERRDAAVGVLRAAVADLHP
ncbi:IclR family transcriptional regulator [Dietzia cercidiphylli]|uniref:IclR family transcriptional regulator n=1 Tax=Dietzia TaxID=37914 RepID=UPI0015C9A9A6|nr:MULTISPECIES: IclR family transcriptional regulator [unclassified Dietzia]MBB1041572.1 IclR family transcriptional regulator [Dietzia sp. Cai40]MBB1051289.1 IclR family transcriptional regulator [Dietzia sp. CW19]MBB1057485.1 IclR family transcriptional regulator [Dietzia sp. B19]